MTLVVENAKLELVACCATLVALSGLEVEVPKAGGPWAGKEKPWGFDGTEKPGWAVPTEADGEFVEKLKPVVDSWGFPTGPVTPKCETLACGLLGRLATMAPNPCAAA